MLNVLEGTPKGKTKRECNSQEKKKKGKCIDTT